ncbi:retrovirus-related pol polyprotein from transposon TNT 1-94 [Tanacetum coccineum]
MLTQQDIYAASSENRPPMLNKDNNVPWSSRLLRYAKSRPNGKLIYNSIVNGPYVRRMILEPGDPNREILVNETFHEQTDDELTEKERKQVEDDDQVIQTILLGLPEDIYAAVDSCETTQEIWLRVQQMMKGSDIGIQEKKAKLFNEWHIAQPGMNMSQERQMQMVGGNGGNQFRQYAGQNVGNQNGYNALQYVENQNQNKNGNVVAARAEGNAIGNNGNQIRCYNYRGLGHFARNCTVRPRRRDAAYLQTQLLIDQKKEVGLQLQAEEYDLMAAATDLDEIEEVNVNCILMANLQQASSSATQTDTAPVYDSYISAEVHNYDNCYDNEIFNMFTQEEQYTELLEPIPKIHQVQQNDSNVISEVSGIEQDGGIQAQQKQQSLYDGTVLLEKHDPPAVYDSEETLQLAQEKAAKFVREFKSLANEVDGSLAKNKALELEIERLLRAIFSQDIMSIMQSNSVVDSSNLQTKLDRTKERFENSYNDMQQKIERLQAQLGDLKGKSKDTSSVSNTFDPLSQKLENENIELEYKVLNYAKENDHLKTTYKNLFDSISVTRTQTKSIIDSLQNKLHEMIYKNAKLIAQLFDKVSEQKDTSHGTSANTKFVKQSILGKPPSSSRPKLYTVTPLPKSKAIPKIDKTRALSNPVTSNIVPTPQESKVMKNDKVIAPGLFRINPFKPSREEKVDNTAKTRRPQPRSNTKNDKVPSASKNSCKKNKEVKVEEHPRNLPLSKNKKHMSSTCNNVKLAIRNDESEVVCAMCCSKHMTENLQLLINFVWKFLGTVRFGNDHVVAILGFGDLQWGNILITRVIIIRIDNGTEFKNQILKDYFDSVGISHQASSVRTPQQNGVAEAIATACFTQNRSIIHGRFNKTPYELINGRKQDISFLHVFGALCYPKNDREDIGKLGAKGLNLPYAIDNNKQLNNHLKVKLDVMFDAMYDDYIGGQPSAAPRTVPPIQVPLVLQIPMETTTTVDTSPTPSNSSS